MLRRATPALALAVAVLFLAAVTVAATRPGKRPAGTGATSATTATTSSSTTPPPAPRPEVEAEVARLQGFVEQARGLRFAQPVPVTLLDDAAFRARIEQEDEDDEAELEATKKVLVALGLLERDVDLEALGDALAGDLVLGFYDPETDELVLRGASLTPAVRQTLVHELTHALQDQHFQLHRPDLDAADDEASLAFSALVEGDAERIEQLYEASLPARERAQLQAESQRFAAGLDLDDVPPVLLSAIGFPYVAGPPFVEAVLARGGNGRLDGVFRQPPTTSEHVLHAERFFGQEAPRPVAEPPADGSVFDRGVVGEFGIRLILGAAGRRQQGARAAAGWGGDRYVAWERDGRTCFRAHFAMDSGRDADELAEALGAVSGRSGSVEGTDPVRFTRCS